MAFRFTDLMITVLPSVDEDVLRHGCFICTNTRGCFNPFTLCPFSRPIIDQPIQYSVNELAILKEQLLQTLAQVEAQEEASKKIMRPQTLAEARALEEKMVNALDELRRQEEELEKKTAEGQG